MNLLADFHFLRPGWLLMLLPAALICWRALRRADPTQAWRDVMEPHLLAALAIDDQTKVSRWRPAHLLGAGLVLACLAMAGPAWEREPTPFAQDQAAIFLLLKVTPTMQAQDIQPSRLARAVQKIDDFLDLKAGQRSGLIAYAGTAHLAMPLTSDPNVINTFAAALTPDAMPQEGNDLLAAVRLANQRLQRAGQSGSLLLLADEIDPQQIDGLREAYDKGGAPLHILAVAGAADIVPPPGSPPAPPLDEDSLREAARAGGGDLVIVSPDDRDIRQLAAAVERNVRDAPGNESAQWRDMGWWLLPFLALLLLLFFRPGGGVLLE